VVARRAINVMIEREAEHDIELAELRPLFSHVHVLELAPLPLLCPVPRHQIDVRQLPTGPYTTATVQPQHARRATIRREFAERAMIAPGIEDRLAIEVR
jgi:hypothetical protein